MKKSLFKLTLLLGLFAFAFSSCDLNDDDYSLDKYFISYGTLKVTEGTIPSIVLDDESVVYITVSNISFAPSANDKRVIANYTILSSKTEGYKKSYTAKLNAIAEILTKEPLLSSDVTEDEVGKDPIIIEDSWFSSKYLNINFTVYANDPSIKHFINLVVDQTNPKADEDNVYLTFTHNAFGDKASKEAYGKVSFDVSSLIAPGKNAITLHLSHTNYKGQTIIESGKITLGEVNNGDQNEDVNKLLYKNIK